MENNANLNNFRSIFNPDNLSDSDLLKKELSERWVTVYYTNDLDKSRSMEATTNIELIRDVNEEVELQSVDEKTFPIYVRGLGYMRFENDAGVQSFPVIDLGFRILKQNKETVLCA